MTSAPARVAVIGAGNMGAATLNALALLGAAEHAVLLDRDLARAEGQRGTPRTARRSCAAPRPRCDRVGRHERQLLDRSAAIFEDADRDQAEWAGSDPEVSRNGHESQGLGS